VTAKLTSVKAHMGQIWALVAAHLVLGLVASVVLPQTSDHRMQSTFSAALLGAQYNLLAFWGALALIRWWQRLVGTVLGVVWLAVLAKVSLYNVYGIWDQSTWEYAIGPAFCTLANLAVFLAVFRWRVALRRVNGQSVGWQFSTFGMLYFTGLVAFTFLWSKVIFWLAMATTFTEWAQSVTAMLGVVTCWAVLGQHRPALPILVALMCGLSYANWATAHWGTGNFRFPLGMTPTFFIETVILLASLFVVRSCGYRLVTHSQFDGQRQEQPNQAENSASTLST